MNIRLLNSSINSIKWFLLFETLWNPPLENLTLPCSLILIHYIMILTQYQWSSLCWKIVLNQSRNLMYLPTLYSTLPPTPHQKGYENTAKVVFSFMSWGINSALSHQEIILVMLIASHSLTILEAHWDLIKTSHFCNPELDCNLEIEQSFETPWAFNLGYCIGPNFLFLSFSFFFFFYSFSSSNSDLILSFRNKQNTLPLFISL